MHLGLHLANFTWSGGSSTFVDDLVRTARTAEDVGFTRLSVMDHVWQIGMVGPKEHEMLEAYTALGFLAAVTEKVQLLAWVTAAVYREPGLLAKAVTTLDVLSKGRAMLGIGAAWNEEECVGLGLPFPATAERFERLEETLQICLQMWGDSVEPYTGKHYRLGSTLNSPQSVQRPRPPILIGGGGEKKTLRMVAQYAQACNLFDSPDLAHKLEVLRGHCEALGRDYDEIEKTVMGPVDPGPDGANVDATLEHLRDLAGLGVTHVQLGIGDGSRTDVLELIGERIIPEAARF
ncbi:LLM class F420-dependent oxidoreductase [Terracoccus sp. 273MFTsu3.1]|uniref:LLM class F420-dependent oxidoreductase n=1 Tax=Terracoccus sp. 273MFTsu3.1 TaxID=1172188 RepID=UPI00035DAFAB|nr:LLM class F420-dependent oxidoreductase [Terracoccus sp. 273MFTsu3.1]